MVDCSVVLETAWGGGAACVLSFFELLGLFDFDSLGDLDLSRGELEDLGEVLPSLIECASLGFSDAILILSSSNSSGFLNF